MHKEVNSLVGVYGGKADDAKILKQSMLNFIVPRPTHQSPQTYTLEGIARRACSRRSCVTKLLYRGYGQTDCCIVDGLPWVAPSHRK